jgi:hypothetical protein
MPPEPRPFPLTFRLPTDEQVLEAALGALRARRTVRSESALLSIVRQALRRGDPELTVGRRRMRLVCLRSGKVEVTAFTRYSDERRPLSRCPVCRGAIVPIRNRTVYDGSVTLGHRCTQCGYWTGIRRRIPTLYVYTRRGAGRAEGDAGPRSLKIVDARDRGG